MFYGLKLLKIEKFTLEQPKEIFYNSIIQTVAFSAHILTDTFLLEHLAIMLVLILPSLVGMENQTRSIRYGFKSFIEYTGYHP